jgi:hypothetical protein
MLHADSSAIAMRQAASDGVQNNMPCTVQLKRPGNRQVEPPSGRPVTRQSHVTPPGESKSKNKRARKQEAPNGMIGRTAPRAAAAGVADWTPQYIAEQQANDPDKGSAIEWLSSSNRPPASPALRALWQQFESLVMRNGAVYRIFHNFDGSVRNYQLVLPNSKKVVFLEMVHADAAGHLKFVECLEHVQKRAWWFTKARPQIVYSVVYSIYSTLITTRAAT